MNIAVSALAAPTKDSLDEWLNTPRLAKCGEFFTPSEPMWCPDSSSRDAINWQTTMSCVPSDWQRWLHAALAYRMSECAQRTIAINASVFSRAAQAGLNPINQDHLLDLRERFNIGEFSSLFRFMVF